MKRENMKTRNAAFIAVVVLAGILAGCAGGPQVKTSELDNKGNAVGVPTPDWIKLYVSQGITAVQNQSQYKGKYCIIGEENSLNKQFALAWADNFSAQQRIGAMLRTNIESKYTAAVSGRSQSTGGANSSTAAGAGSADYKQEIDNVLSAVVNVSYSGAQRDSDWWVLTRRYDPDQKDVFSDEYTAYVLYTIPKEELNGQIARAMETAVAKDSVLYDITIQLAKAILLDGVEYLDPKAAEVPAPAAQPAAPAAPAAGTIASGAYTFYPRPQATQGGIAVTTYLDKIEFNDDYTLIYITSAAQGVSSAGLISGIAGNWNTNTVMLTDADDPSKTFQPSNVSGGTISFRRLPVKKFNLAAGTGERAVIFRNITLPANPDR